MSITGNGLFFSIDFSCTSNPKIPPHNENPSRSFRATELLARQTFILVAKINIECLNNSTLSPKTNSHQYQRRIGNARTHLATCIFSRIQGSLSIIALHSANKCASLSFVVLLSHLIYHSNRLVDVAGLGQFFFSATSGVISRPINSA